ncbi:hypothetical protein ACIBEJ_34450 [Nonomuraea sp. NPDC050790]|uniref:hypothetical protein n=1 Tax=Nonomuraea sp. NPDC050790 TaxID=3364371 RepID=UPI0037B06E76
MAWGRVDDAFDDHPKVLALLDIEDLKGAAAALGLWTLCFTWAHRNTRKKGKVPGRIPSSLPRRFFGPEAREMAALLVEVGLWDATSDGGWMIHDFADYLPGREVSEARAEAGRKGAEARWGRKADGNLPSLSHRSDGKADSKRMAPDGKKDVGEINSETPRTESGSNGSEPSADGNLPSGSHSSDGKPIASDGSRAGARREWVDVRTTVLSPTPTPIQPPAGADAPDEGTTGDEPLNAKAVVAAWVESAQARTGDRPANSLIGQVGRQAKQLIDEGKDPARLMAAASEAGRKGYADLGRELLRINAGPDPGGGRFAPNSGSRAKLPTADEIRNGQVNL